MTTVRNFAFWLIIAIPLSLLSAQAQTSQVSTVNLTPDSGRVRVAAVGEVFDLRIEVVDEAGDTVFESSQVADRPLDWNMTDSHGKRVPPGTYTMTVSYTTQAGKPRKRIEQILVTEEVTAGGGAEKADGQKDSSPTPAAVGTISGQGTIGRLAKFTGTNTIGNSSLTDSGTRIGVNSTNPLAEIGYPAGWNGLHVRSAGHGVAAIHAANGIARLHLSDSNATAGKRNLTFDYNNSSLQLNALSDNLALVRTVMTLAHDGGVSVGGNLGAAGNLTANGTVTASGYKIGTVNALSRSNGRLVVGPAASIATGTGIFIGDDSGTQNTGQGVISIGTFAGYYTKGNHNLFVGHRAGYKNETGGINSFVGNDAGLQNTYGTGNTFLGYKAGLSNTTSNLNTFVGIEAGAAYIGEDEESPAFQGLNTFVGAQAARRLIGGSHNTFIGTGAGSTMTGGRGNTLIGNGAVGSTTGDNNTFIGSNAGAGTDGINGSTAVGYNARVMQSNSIVLGTNFTLGVGIGTTAPRAKLHVEGGNIYVFTAGSGIILKSPDGTKCAKVTLSNAGALVSTSIPCS